MQSYDYDNCMPTFCSINELKILPFRIKTISIDKTYMQLNHYLQAPQFVIQRAFEGDGNWHKWQDAPINELLTKQSSKYFDISSNLKIDEISRVFSSTNSSFSIIKLNCLFYGFIICQFDRSHF